MIEPDIGSYPRYIARYPTLRYKNCPYDTILIFRILIAYGFNGILKGFYKQTTEENDDLWMKSIQVRLVRGIPQIVAV